LCRTRFYFSHTRLRVQFKCLSNTVHEDLLVTSTDNSETSDSSRPLSHQQLAYPFLGQFLSTLFSYMQPSIHIVFLPSHPRLTFYPSFSLSFSPYALPYFTYASCPLYFFPLLIISFSINFSSFFSID